MATAPVGGSWAGRRRLLAPVTGRGAVRLLSLVALAGRRRRRRRPFAAPFDGGGGVPAAHCGRPPRGRRTSDGGGVQLPRASLAGAPPARGRVCAVLDPFWRGSQRRRAQPGGAERGPRSCTARSAGAGSRRSSARPPQGPRFAGFAPPSGVAASSRRSPAPPPAPSEDRAGRRNALARPGCAPRGYRRPGRAGLPRDGHSGPSADPGRCAGRAAGRRDAPPGAIPATPRAASRLPGRDADAVAPAAPPVASSASFRPAPPVRPATFPLPRWRRALRRDPRSPDSSPRLRTIAIRKNGQRNAMKNVSTPAKNPTIRCRSRPGLRCG